MPDEAEATDEGVGSLEQALDATCKVTIDQADASVGPDSGSLKEVANAQCADSALLEYRLTALNPKSKTVVISDWSASSSGAVVLPAGSPQGTYTMVAEARRSGTTTVVAKATKKVVGGQACTGAVVYTSPSGGVPLDSLVLVQPLLYCPPDLPREWRVSVAKPGGGSVTTAWQQGKDVPVSTAGWSAGTATFTVSMRNVGNTVVDATAKTTLVVGPVCTASKLTASGSGNARTLTATSSCVNGGNALYRFSVTAPNGTVTQLRDYDANGSFAWDVTGLDGGYNTKVEVRAEGTSTTPSAKTLKLNLGSACTKLTLPDTWGSHVRSTPMSVTATANCTNAEYQFQRRVPTTTAWTTVCPYSSSATCDLDIGHQPTGDYVIRALVRKQGSIAAYDAVSLQREYMATNGVPLLRALPVANSISAVAISADGRWIGARTSRWSRTNGVTAMARPYGVNVGWFPGGATDINDTGTVIVGWDTNFLHVSVGQDEPYRWVNGAVDWLLPHDVDHITFYAAKPRATSSNGSVVVGYMQNAAGHPYGTEAFVWSTTGGLQLLGDLPDGDTISDASDVSADGKVVVGVGRAGDHDEAFKWTAATGMVALGLPPGDTSSAAVHVSRDGKVAVGNSLGADSRHHAVRWTPAGGPERLPDLPGMTFAWGLTASGDGRVIGGMTGPSNEPYGGGAAVLWTDGNPQLVKDLLVASGVDTTGWDLQSVTDISADGKTVLGSGVVPGVGQYADWLVTLP
ncbi:MAG TPA: hypothetical protein VHB79_28090 [Polyangiaceae bacterium]|nr:hypothetical protein [Polyangiaceae bacterium]